MINAPGAGERLWVDDLQEFGRRLNATADQALRVLACRFQRDGYVHLKGVVDAGLVAEAIRAYNEWCADTPKDSLKIRPDGRNPRIVNLHGERNEIKNLFTRSEEVLRVLDFLFGYRASVYTSLTFQYGTEQPLHRDTPVFRTEPEEFYFGVWYALEDADEENGCLMAVPGGHRVARLDQYEFAKQRVDDVSSIPPTAGPLWTQYQDAVVKECKECGCEPVLLPAKAGDVIIWHPELPHGGSPIKDTTKTRNSVVFHVTPEDVPVYQADVFFNEKSQPSRKSAFTYETYEGRQFVSNRANVGSN